MATYTQTNCDHCTLGEAMKDCPACRFARGLDAHRAPSADVFRMYRRLWRDYAPQDFDDFRMCVPNELIDFTQLSTWKMQS